MRTNKRLFVLIPLIVLLCFGLILAILLNQREEPDAGLTENNGGASGEDERNDGKTPGGAGNDNSDHPHAYSAWTVITQSTCIETGREERVCSCGNVETREIKTTGVHIYENGTCKNCGAKEPTPSIGLDFELNNDGKSYSVVGIGGCTDYDVIIPSTYNDMPVTWIGIRAFEFCPQLVSITIPDSVTGISSQAFSNCGNLKSITIGRGVNAVGGRAFEFCEKLKEVHINDIASWCNIKWSENPFDYHNANALYLNGRLVTDLVIPEGVTSIEKYAFRNYNGLTSVSIPDSVTSIGDQAFYNCDGLTSITIGSGVAYIGKTAFGSCQSLRSITVSADNSTYHSAGNCLIKTGTKTLVLGCESSVIPADGSIVSIGDSAFSYYSGLTSITIPDGVTTIGEYAFANCEALASITMPNTIVIFEGHSFRDCGIDDIFFGGTKAEWDNISKVYSSKGIVRPWDQGVYRYTIHCSDGDIIVD